MIGCVHRQLLKLHFAHPHRIEADLPQTRHHQAFLQPNNLQVPRSLFAELSAGSNRFFLAHPLGWQVSVHHVATVKHCVGLDSFWSSRQTGRPSSTDQFTNLPILYFCSTWPICADIFSAFARFLAEAIRFNASMVRLNNASRVLACCCAVCRFRHKKYRRCGRAGSSPSTICVWSNSSGWITSRCNSSNICGWLRAEITCSPCTSASVLSFARVISSRSPTNMISFKPYCVCS